MYNYVIEPLVLEKFRPVPNLMLTFLIALMPLTEFLQETEKSFLSGFVYVCLLITLTRSPKAELRRVQLDGIGRMHMRGASGCRQTVMNDPGAQQLSQMFMT